MSKIAYLTKRFSPKVLGAIDTANSIIEEYQAQGFILTLRQLYYQFVAHDVFPDDRRWRLVEGTNRWVRDPSGTKNADPNYKWLGGILTDARLAGLTDWDAIEDRTRNLRSNAHWQGPTHLLEWAARRYGVDLWEQQTEHVEVWVEKEALAGVIERPASEWDVSWFCCKGYVSQSALWRASERFKYHENQGQSITIIYLGDHDPSGLNIDPVVGETMNVFGINVTMERIALTMAQVEEHRPPPNPTKMTDSRAADYVSRYGYESWELDALDPATLAGLIEAAIREHCDIELLDEARHEQEKQRKQIQKLSDTFLDDNHTGGYDE